MNTSILIVTHQKDFPWLVWCLKSIARFASGFSAVKISIPSNTVAADITTLSSLYHKCSPSIPLLWDVFDEWMGKGFVHHEYQVICADWLLSEADLVLHMDSDCVFFKPTTPEGYIVNGKPVLIGAPYDYVVNRFRNPYHYKWKEAVERCLGGVSEQEFMRRHPAVHVREVYEKTRQLISEHTGMRASEFIRGQQNSFPQGFAEFPTLGEVAWRHFRNRYHFLRQDKDPWPDDHMIQFWSHGSLFEPNNIWLGGSMKTVVPIEEMKKIGL